ITADGFPLPPGAVHRFGSRQLRHPGDIAAVAISPDSRFLATASYEGVIVWDLTTQNVERSFTHLSVSQSGLFFRGGWLAFPPDRRSLLVRGRSRNGGMSADPKTELAQVWDVKTGLKKLALPGQPSTDATCWLTAGGTEIVVCTNTRAGTESTVRF